MTEYYNLVECDKKTLNLEKESMNKDYIRRLERRHEANKQVRLEKGLVAKQEEFINGN